MKKGGVYKVVDGEKVLDESVSQTGLKNPVNKDPAKAKSTKNAKSVNLTTQEPAADVSSKTTLR